MQERSDAPTSSIFAKRVTWLILIVTILFVTGVRWRLLETPLERDEGEYGYTGQLILQGIPPYQLAYNMKLPGTYYAYAAGMALFGQTIRGIHLTLLVVNVTAILFVFLLGRSLFGERAGAFAAASYGIMSMSSAVLGLAAHANHFVVFFVLPAVLLLWHGSTARRPNMMFWSGLLFGVAFLMKQQAVFFGVFGIVFLAWNGFKDREPLLVLMKRAILFGVGMLIPFCLLCLLMWREGVFGKFWFWTFTYAQTYAASNSLPKGIRLLGAYIRGPWTADVYGGFLFLAMAGLLSCRRKSDIQDQLTFLLLLGFFSFLATATGFYFREHYFIQLLPSIALAAGMAVPCLQEWLAGRISPPWARILPGLFFFTVVGWNILIQRNFFFQLSPVEVVRTRYQHELFDEARQVAQCIERNSKPDETVAVLGSEPEIYFEARRRSGTGYIYTYALMEPHPYALTMQKEMEHEIERSHPRFLVDIGNNTSWGVRAGSSQEIFKWFTDYANKSYDLIGLVNVATNGTFTLWNQDARDYHGEVAHFIALYQRRPN